MNRHVKKIESIIVYQKKQTAEIIEKINNIKDTSYVVIYNPECIGIMNSSIEIFGKEHCLGLCEIFNSKQIEEVAKAIIEKKFKQVIFATMAYGYKELAETIYNIDNTVAIKFMWHGSHALFVNVNEQKFLEDILQLQKRNIVKTVGYFKRSMANFYAKKGYNSCLLMNIVNIQNKDEYKRNPKDKRLNFGLYSAGDRWEKNTYNQLSACAMNRKAFAEIIPQTKLAASFCELMRIKTLTDEELPALSRHELLKHMANNDVNLYVTFTECSPMIPLESFEVGVPCIIGNNTEFFKNSKLEEYLVVKEEDSIDEIYEKMNLCLEHRDEIMELYATWRKEYEKEVEKCKEAFLNS